MLHSTLPRAFLPPVLQSYAAGYCADDVNHLYTTSSSYVPCIEDPYSKISDNRVELRNWETETRPMSPSPLDLSLKPTQNNNENIERNEDTDEIEVDDEDDAKCRISLLQRRNNITTKRLYTEYDELPLINEDIESETHRSDSVHSYHSHDDLQISRKEEIEQKTSSVHFRSHHNDILRNQSQNYNYDAISMKKDIFHSRDIGNRKTNIFQDPSVVIPCIIERNDLYHNTMTNQQKIIISSPTTPRGQNCNQQLLMTPQNNLNAINAPMTPPSTPSPPQCPRRRQRDESDVTPSSLIGTTLNITPKNSSNTTEKNQRPKKKHARRLKFDEDTSSPVSGTVILGPDEAVVTGDIDPAFNIVEVTEEARAELAKIENRLGPYQCKLCRQLHDDAFQLAQHRCSRIAHVEYRCPECDKRFSCPANLASHRRWHKPRITNGDNTNNTASTNTSGSSNTTRDPEISCTRCEAKFTRTAALRKHLATQHPETNNNGSMANNNNNNDNNPAFDEVNNPMLGKPLCINSPVHLGNTSVNNEIA